MPRLSQAKAIRELTLKITYYGSIFLLIIHTNYMAVYLKTSAEEDLFNPPPPFSSFDNFRIRKFHHIFFVLVGQYSPENPPKHQGSQQDSCHSAPCILIHNFVCLKDYIPINHRQTRNVHTTTVNLKFSLYVGWCISDLERNHERRTNSQNNYKHFSILQNFSIFVPWNNS